MCVIAPPGRPSLINVADASVGAPAFRPHVGPDKIAGLSFSIQRVNRTAGGTGLVEAIDDDLAGRDTEPRSPPHTWPRQWHEP
jgi:hypothetical protein